MKDIRHIDQLIRLFLTLICIHKHSCIYFTSTTKPKVIQHDVVMPIDKILPSRLLLR